jgi:hypothetical protein
VHPQGGVYNPKDAYNTAFKKVSDLSFGPNKAGFIPLLKAAQSQGGATHAAEVANGLSTYFRDPNPYWRIAARKQLQTVFGKGAVEIAASSPYREIGEGETKVRRAAAPMFLPRISIPHATQAPLNSLMINGLADSFKAFADFARNPRDAYNLSLRAGAQSQELVHEFTNLTRGTTMFSRLADPLRKVFNFERKWGIAFSAVSGKHAAIDAAEDYARTQSNRSLLQLKVLGLDPQAVLQRGGRLTADEIETAAFRSASEIMGFRSPLETPMRWEQNAAMRFSTMYKHYGFRQAKLIKDSLVRAKAAEGWLGVAKTTSLLGTSFFAAGEMIKAAENIVSGRDPSEDYSDNLAFEYLDGVAHAGGFGIIYSMVNAAKRNYLTSYLAGGPIIDSAANLIQDAVHLNGTAMTREVLRKFGLPGTFLSNMVLPPSHEKKKETPYY